MRYLLQLVIPALIFVAVVYLLTRRRDSADPTREQPPRERSDVLPLLAILALGAVVAVASAVALQALVG